MQESIPKLISCKSMKAEFQSFQEIAISSEEFTIGRGLNNKLLIPFLAISRNHCKLIKNDNDWILEDYSTVGITVNRVKVGKGNRKRVNNQDVIVLEPSQEFVYKFVNEDEELMPPSVKRIKLELGINCKDYVNNMKVKFQESQNYEMKHIEDKIQNTKQIKNTNMLLKEQLQLDMKRKIEKLESDFAVQIENLKGEKNEVERQKALLIGERDSQLAILKQNMEGKISDLMEQIRKHNEIESELIVENNLLKEKLLKERDEFLLELNRESSLKQDMLNKLEAKMKEQEEVRLKEKQEFELLLQKETEKLTLAKEKELTELAEQNKQKELELMDELKNIKTTLEQQEKQKIEVELQYNIRLEEMKKMKAEDQFKMEKMEEQLNAAQQNAQKSIENLKIRVTEREVELAALAAERIQKQAEQSGEVISSLQEQLEKVRSQLQSVESEKEKLLKSKAESQEDAASTSKLNEFGEIMESELQCIICSELFMSAITLNCSHTFCTYCITMWKKKKKDCPICRTYGRTRYIIQHRKKKCRPQEKRIRKWSPITSECKSLVLDSFIEKMVQNLTEEMKQKRKDMLKNREELENELNQPRTRTSRRSSSYERDDEFLEEEEESNEDYQTHQNYEDSFDDDDYDSHSSSDWFEYGSVSDSGSDVNSETAGTDAASNNAAGVATRADDSRGRDRVPGLPDAYYGGYGHCFRCGARGHWAPGCPLQTSL